MLRQSPAKGKAELYPNLMPKLTLEQIVRESTLYDPDPAEQTRKIVEMFNAGNKEDITVESVPLGKRIDQDEFRLVHRNNVPQLVPWSYYPRRLGVYWTGVTKEIGVFKQTDLVIGGHGRYVVNVPQGKLVKAWLGNNEPIFLAAGPHVIRHPNFRLDAQHTVNLSDQYISHGNFHILRVPRGKVAKIWLGSTPHLLEAREEPYIFNDPTFKIMFTQENQQRNYFYNASDRLIEHGSIKRILPRTGEVAVTYDNGRLKILEASDRPFTVDSPTFVMDGFQQTAAQTLVFPSKKTQEERLKANPADKDNVNYEEFRTSDGLPIGVKLLVVYEVHDPEKTLTRLKKDDIINHIENIVVADMGRVIQSCSSSDFQKSSQTSVKDPRKIENMPIFQNESAPTFYAHLQDEVKNKLAKDLIDWGITLVRLNIETPKILDKGIASEMAKNSLETAKKRAEASRLATEYTITQQSAERDAEKKRIEQDRLRENKVIEAQGDGEKVKITAQAGFEAAKMNAEASRVTYTTDIEKIKLENQTALDKKQKEYDMEIAFLKQKAELFNDNEPFRQLQIAKAQAEALKGISTSVISPEVAQSWYATARGVGFFAAGPNLQQLQKEKQPLNAAPEPQQVEKSVAELK